jgi:hypothetical protein
MAQRARNFTRAGFTVTDEAGATVSGRVVFTNGRLEIVLDASAPVDGEAETTVRDHGLQVGLIYRLEAQP